MEMCLPRLRGSSDGHAGLTPEQIAEVRPRLLAFAGEMLAGLARSDQRAAGELYVRGLLTGGQRKSMVPMAARLGVDHQRLQQFITSPAWDYVAVRRSVARDFAARQKVEALVVDDTGFAKDGSASPCVARQYSGTLGKVGNRQIGVSVHLVNEHASCAADWRLCCPESWDDAALADPVLVARARQRRERARIPGEVRHTEKWRLALEMIDEMTGPGGWDVLEQVSAVGDGRPVAVSDAGFGDITAFRLGLAARGWRYVVAVRGTTSAYPGGAQPAAPARRAGPGRPPGPAYPGPPASLRQLAIASADQIQPVTWRQGTKGTKGNPDALMTSHFVAIRVRPANRDIPRAADGSLPDCWLLAEWPPEASEPTGYWLSDLPPDTPLAELVRLAKIRWRIEMVFSQLAKGRMRAIGRCWQHIADLDFAVGDDHAVDEQFHQQPPLRERGCCESGTDGLAERFDPVGDGTQLQPLLGDGFELALLGQEGGMPAVQFLPLALKFSQPDHLGQVGVQEPLQLAL
jgi:SRSO17 transposase